MGTIENIQDTPIWITELIRSGLTPHRLAQSIAHRDKVKLARHFKVSPTKLDQLAERWGIVRDSQLMMEYYFFPNRPVA